MEKTDETILTVTDIFQPIKRSCTRIENIARTVKCSMHCKIQISAASYDWRNNGNLTLR
jgi:hypothetical protein